MAPKKEIIMRDIDLNRPETALKKCSCGSSVFIKKSPVAGYWLTYFTIQEDGEVLIEGNGDNVKTIRQPKFIRCEECGKKYPNPDFP